MHVREAICFERSGHRFQRLVEALRAWRGLRNRQTVYSGTHNDRALATRGPFVESHPERIHVDAGIVIFGRCRPSLLEAAVILGTHSASSQLLQNDRILVDKISESPICDDERTGRIE